MEMMSFTKDTGDYWRCGDEQQGGRAISVSLGKKVHGR